MTGERWCMALLMNLCFVAPTLAQEAIRGTADPRNNIDVTFVPAPEITFPNPADSNSPIIWDGDALYIFNSFAGQPGSAMGMSRSKAFRKESIRTA